MHKDERTLEREKATGVDPLDVCSLSPEELADRLKWIRSEILRHARGKQRMQNGIALVVENIPGMPAQVDRWIELERDCCQGIQFERHPGQTSGEVRVEIHGVNPDGQLFSELQDLPNPLEPPVSSPAGASTRLGRVLRAGGLGTLASVTLFCILPLALAAGLGATAVAAPLAALDDPLWIGLGALLGGVLGWIWLGRSKGAKV
jgi:hypothetical protein